MNAPSHPLAISGVVGLVLSFFLVGRGQSTKGLWAFADFYSRALCRANKEHKNILRDTCKYQVNIVYHCR